MKNRIILTFIIITFAISCKNGKENQYLKENEVFIENQTKRNLDAFLVNDTVLIKNDIYYDKLINVINRGEFLIKSINNGSYKIDSVNSFYKYINSFANEGQIFENTSTINLLNKHLYENAIYNIKFIVYVSSNLLLKSYMGEYVAFNRYKPIVVPSKNPIKLGETFEGKVYMTGYNSINKYEVIIDNDTLPYDKEFNNLPIIKIKPDKKGVHVIKGVMNYYRPVYGKVSNFDFEYTYEVK